MRIFGFLRSRPFIILTLLYCLVLVALDRNGFFAAPPAGDVARLISAEPFDITGTVLRSQRTKKNRELLHIDVLSVDGHPWCGKLLVNSSGQTRARPGDIVYLRGVMKKPRPARTPGAFDYAVYLRRMGIYAVTYVSSVEVLGHTPRPFYLRLADAARSDMIETLKRTLSPDNASVLIPMLIGVKQDLSEEDRRAFTDAGVMHILVVSKKIQSPPMLYRRRHGKIGMARLWPTTAVAIKTEGRPWDRQDQPSWLCGGDRLVTSQPVGSYI